MLTGSASFCNLLKPKNHESTRLTQCKTPPNFSLSVHSAGVWILINMNKVMSHTEFKRVCVCVFFLGMLCVEAENVSLKAPSCSLLHISPITTIISLPLSLPVCQSVYPSPFPLHYISFCSIVLVAPLLSALTIPLFSVC